MSAKILIVDDEELIRWSLSQDLANSGYKTVVAAADPRRPKAWRRKPTSC